jgi:threonine dehydratase
MPGQLTFDIMSDLGCTGLTVSDEEVRNAMRFAFQHLKIVVEPGGAAGLAAILAGKAETAGKTTAIVFSGGNVDAELFASIQTELA